MEIRYLIWCTFVLIVLFQHKSSAKDFRTLYFTEDTSRHLTYKESLERFESGKGSFKAAENLNFSFTDSAVWIQIDQWETSNADILHIEFAPLDTIELYFFNGSQLINKSVLGDNFPFRQRDFPDNFLNRRIPEGCDKILMRVNSDGLMLIPVFVMSLQQYFERAAIYGKAYTIYYVFIILTIIAGLIIYFWTDRPFYLLVYISFILSIVVVKANEMGFLFKYLWPDHPEFNFRYMQFFYIPVFYMLYFNQKLLRLEKLPSFFRYYKIVYWLVAISIAGMIFSEYRISIIFLVYAVVIIQLICLTTTIIFYARFKEILEVWLALGWVIILAAGMIHSLMQTSHLPFNIFTNFVVQFGFVIQLIFFNMAIAANLVSLKKMNQKILQDQKRKLEEEVIERTKELICKNDEINEFSLKLNKQNLLLEQQTRDLQMYQTDLKEMVRKRTDELLESKENLELSIKAFNFLADSIPQLITASDADGTVDYVNQKWLHYTGLTLEDARKGKWIEVIHKNDRKRVLDHWKESVAQLKIFEEIIRIRNSEDGKYRWHIIRALPFFGNSDKVQKWFATLTDIHEQKMISEMLLKANEDLKAINQDLDGVIYLSSHELKTPAANIEGIVAALTEILGAANIKSVEYKNYLKMILASVEVLKSVITQLEEISKVQKQRVSNYELLSVPQILRQAIAELDDVIRLYNPEITLNVNSDATIYYGRVEAIQLLKPVILNAILYHHPERRPEIYISYFTNHICNAIEIRDNGIGIKKELMPKVFQMFKRLNTTVPGIGMGLYFVKRRMENEGGKIEVESEEGKGSIFRLFFKIPG